MWSMLQEMHNPIATTQARKRNFSVRIDDHPENGTVLSMDLNHKLSDIVEMFSCKTANGLYKDIADLNRNEAHVCRNKRVRA